jgi:hypothetical protein
MGNAVALAMRVRPCPHVRRRSPTGLICAAAVVDAVIYRRIQVSVAPYARAWEIC